MSRPFEELTWTEVAELDRARTVAILPIGAVEAHGPHLPLATDVVIAEAMARAAAGRLREAGHPALVLPALHYTSAGFASGFPGTISVSPSTVTALVADIAASLESQGFRTLALANAHLDPTHIASLNAARAAASHEGFALLHPDVTRRPWALRLTEEFRSGACHAGRYEGSIVMAARPDLVRRERARELPANPASLSVAIRDGIDSFEGAGGPQAYFGAPAEATADEGVETIATLGAILFDAVVEHLSGAPT
ncbi:creatininase family protein [Gaopeijia maritima]|uniref:Creatininase family protein n=1 Tax=Gaopeijia maritima TaxID=3119007 RepID=A0ABU9E5Y5_9BACT